MIQHKIYSITVKTGGITSQRSFSVFSLPERKIINNRTKMCGKDRIQKWDLFLTRPSLLVHFVVDLWEVASAAKFVAHLGNNSLVQTFGFATFGGILEKKSYEVWYWLCHRVRGRTSAWTPLWSYKSPRTSSGTRSHSWQWALSKGEVSLRSLSLYLERGMLDDSV